MQEFLIKILRICIKISLNKIGLKEREGRENECKISLLTVSHSFIRFDIKLQAAL